MSIFKLVEEKFEDSVSFHLAETAKEISISNQLQIVPICIIGKQKVGKSTLLNQIFGCNFVSQDNVSERSTIGVDGFLYKENQDSSEGVLVFDTEGLKSQQKQDEIYELLHHLPDEHRWECAEKFNNQSNQLLSAFLWCSCEVIIYYLNVSTPCSDDLNFFTEILKTKRQLQNANALPHVIFAVRSANPDQFDNIITNYQLSLRKTGAWGLLKTNPEFIQIHSKDDETRWYKSALDLKDKIYGNIKSRQNLYKLFPVYLSMIEGLLNSLNNNGDINNLENRIMEAEDSFVFRLSEKMRLELGDDLSSLRIKRQEVTVAFRKVVEEMEKLCNYFDNEKEISDNHNILGVTNTVFSVAGVGLGLMGLIFPPTALFALGGALISAVASTGTNIVLNREISDIIQKIVDQTTLVQKVSEDLSQKLHDYLNYKRQMQDKYLIPLVLIDKYDFKFSVTTILYPDFDTSKILQTLLNDGKSCTVKNKELSTKSVDGGPTHSQWRAFMAMKDVFGTASVLSRHGLIDAGKWAKTNFGRGVLTRFFGKWAEKGVVKVLPVVGVIFEAGMVLYSLKEWNDGHPAVAQLLEAKSQLKPQLNEIIEIRESFSEFEDKIQKTVSEIKQQ